MVQKRVRRAGGSAEWEIPSFERRVFTRRRHPYALVIPVLNEGRRIRDQLEKLSALKFPIDVIIADGGSSDGALNKAFLRKAGVRALLVKTGAGRLSAQLRMAYAWCLREGYKGIITVDGNGKDDLSAIPLFLEKLKQGYGLVQGSRYRPGGQAVNTPLDRQLANRLIHAPLISLRARHWYTDTTNGFRAYSAKFLRDARVAPFRAVFDRYMLLFYLSVRAPQLGYKVTEVPVTRRYPLGGPIPTKVSGLKERRLMMEELLKVTLGQMRP